MAPTSNVVRVFRCQESGFSVPIVLARDDHERLTTPMLPELEIPLEILLE